MERRPSKWRRPRTRHSKLRKFREQSLVFVRRPASTPEQVSRAGDHTHAHTHTSLVTGRRAIKGLRLEGSEAALRKQQTRKV